MTAVFRLTLIVVLAGLAACESAQVAPDTSQAPTLKVYSDGPPGLVDGRLAPCTPSDCHTSDGRGSAEQIVEPFVFPEQSPEYVWFSLRESIIALQGDIIRDSTVYLAAHFHAQGGYTDDLEVRVDWKLRKLHFRTAKRVGNDEVNLLKPRLKLLRKALAARLNHPR